MLHIPNPNIMNSIPTKTNTDGKIRQPNRLENSRMSKVTTSTFAIALSAIFPSSSMAAIMAQRATSRALLRQFILDGEDVAVRNWLGIYALHAILTIDIKTPICPVKGIICPKSIDRAYKETVIAVRAFNA